MSNVRLLGNQMNHVNRFQHERDDDQNLNQILLVTGSEFERLVVVSLESTQSVS